MINKALGKIKNCYFYSLAILLVAGMFLAPTKANAQEVPSQVCLGNCPTSATSITPNVSVTASVTANPSSVQTSPTNSATSAPSPTATSTNPTSANSLSSIFNIDKEKNGKRGKHGRHGRHGKKGLIEKLLEILIWLIMKVLESLGISTGDIGSLSDILKDADDTKNVTTAPTSASNDNVTSAAKSPIPTTSTTTSSAPVSGTTSPSTTISTTISQPVVVGCTQEDIQKLVDSVSEQNIRTYLENLVDDDATPEKDEQRSRHTSNEGNQIEAEYIRQQFESFGYQASFQPIEAGGETVNNIIGTLPGKTANSFYTLSAHMDSMPSSGAAPGAEDDGSGTALIMEAGRVLKGFQQCMNSGIELFATNDEEGGMNGSSYYVSNLGGKTIVGNFNFDMVGNTDSSGPCNDSASNGSVGQELVTKYEEVNTKYGINNVGNFGTGGGSGVDAENFWDAGIPSVNTDSCSFSSVYHTSNDTMQYINFAQIVSMTKIAVAAAAELTMQ